MPNILSLRSCNSIYGNLLFSVRRSEGLTGWTVCVSFKQRRKKIKDQEKVESTRHKNPLRFASFTQPEGNSRQTVALGLQSLYRLPMQHQFHPLNLPLALPDYICLLYAKPKGIIFAFKCTFSENFPFLFVEYFSDLAFHRFHFFHFYAFFPSALVIFVS